MKKANWIMALALIFSVSNLTAQKEDSTKVNRKEKIESLKRAYITDKLTLTTAEAEKFWPIYNAHAKQEDVVKQAIQESNKKLKSGTLSEKETIAAIDVITLKHKEQADLEGQFMKDCIPVLGAKKVSQLSGLQREFQKEMMQQLKNRRKENMDGGQRQRPGKGQGQGKMRN